MDWIKNHPRLSIGILAAVHVILFTLALVIEDLWGPFIYPGTIEIPIIIMLSLSQGCLLGIWTALVGNRIYWQVAITYVGIITSINVLYRYANFNMLTDFCISLFTMQTFITSIVLLVARFIGFKINRLTNIDLEKISKPFQFSIWDLMAWTAVVAIILSGTHFFPKGFGVEPLNIFTDPLLNVVCIAVCIATIWLTLGEKKVLLRIFLWLITTILSAIVLNLFVVKALTRFL